MLFLTWKYGKVIPDKQIWHSLQERSCVDKKEGSCYHQ